MTNLTYTTGRPAGNISPAAQRVSMTTNNDSNASIWTQDHYGFNDNNGGTHKYVRMPANVALPGMINLQSGLGSVTGVADPTKSQLVFKNSLATFPVSLFKAYGFITGTTLSNAYNVTSVTNPSTGQYLVTLSVTLTGSYGVILTPATPSGGGFPNIAASYVILNSTQFRIYTQDTQNSTGLNVSNLTFIVLQF